MLASDRQIAETAEVMNTFQVIPVLCPGKDTKVLLTAKHTRLCEAEGNTLTVACESPSSPQ